LKKRLITMATKMYYVQVEIAVDENYHFEDFWAELANTCVYVELSEDEGFEGVVTRAAIRPF
jgi:hypothetical protein